jgi:hypothetical protein
MIAILSTHDYWQLYGIAAAFLFLAKIAFDKLDDEEKEYIIRTDGETGDEEIAKLATNELIEGKDIVILPPFKNIAAFIKRDYIKKNRTTYGLKTQENEYLIKITRTKEI